MNFFFIKRQTCTALVYDRPCGKNIKCRKFCEEHLNLRKLHWAKYNFYDVFRNTTHTKDAIRCELFTRSEYERIYGIATDSAHFSWVRFLESQLDTFNERHHWYYDDETCTKTTNVYNLDYSHSRSNSNENHHIRWVIPKNLKYHINLCFYQQNIETWSDVPSRRWSIR